MGGNVQVIGKDNIIHKADRVDLNIYPRKEFIKDSQNLFKTLNSLYKKMFKEDLWHPKTITDTTLFNGSTSFVLDQDLSDSEVLKYKSSVGDIDIVVPDECKENLFLLLQEIEGRKIKKFTFLGSNRTSIDKLGNQINGIFNLNGVNVQVDFEFVKFEGWLPDEFSKFGHSSSFRDAKAGVKALHHKLLLGSVIGVLSFRDDIIVVTPSATEQNWKTKISKKKKDPDDPRATGFSILKFSVDKGIRVGAEYLLTDNGVEVWREVKPANSKYIRNLDVIADHADCTKAEIQDFVSILKRIKRCNRKEKDLITTVYFNKLFSDTAQLIDRYSLLEDFSIKIAGFVKLLDTFGISLSPFKEKILNYYRSNKASSQELQDIDVLATIENKLNGM